MSFLLASAARATIGARSGQEDAFRVWPSEGVVQPAGEGGLLTVLADGMGGHRGGAVAGQTACATFAEVFASTDAPYDQRLKLALDASNEALAVGVERNSALRGMGCTLIGAWFDDGGLRWTSVGDSLLLLFRFPNVTRLNEDHSLGAYLDEQVRRNEISASEAQANRHRNALRSALTGTKIDLIDLHGEPHELRAGDWVLLASDGIASLPGDELADIMYRNHQATPEEMAASLIAAVEAKNLPEQDNTTVVAVRVEGSSERALAPTSTSPEADEVAMRTRRIGVVSGRKVLHIEPTAGGATVRSRAGGMLGSAPIAWLVAAAAFFVLAAALFLRSTSMTPVPSGGSTVQPTKAIEDHLKNKARPQPSDGPDQPERAPPGPGPEPGPTPGPTPGPEAAPLAVPVPVPAPSPRRLPERQVPERAAPSAPSPEPQLGDPPPQGAEPVPQGGSVPPGPQDPERKKIRPKIINVLPTPAPPTKGNESGKGPAVRSDGRKAGTSGEPDPPPPRRPSP